MAGLLEREEREIKWTKEQEEAINARGCSVLVSAAAGAGKTSVLVGRILKHLEEGFYSGNLERKMTSAECGQENLLLDLDNLLVVTFTNAAAAQMREQIARRIKQQLEKNPSSRRLQRQLVLLDYACISTIHSFCLEVLRQHFYQLPLDPQFRVMDEDEAALLQLEVLEEFLEKKYQQPANDGFLQLVDCYGGERSDRGLGEIILQLYRFSRSNPWPEYWLRNAAAALKVPAGGTMDFLPWCAELKRSIRGEVEFCLGELRQAEILCRLPGGPSHYLKVIHEEIATLEACCQQIFPGAGKVATWEELEKVLGAGRIFGQLPGRGKKGENVDEALQERVKKIRNQARKRIRQLQQNYFSLSATEHKEELEKAAKLMDVLVELVIEFGKSFEQAKRDRGVVDFSDLEHYCLRILCDEKASPPALVPSAVARELQERFVEVLVDEYQDINAVQEAILYLVSRESRGEYNRFMVGDVKQSIYRFRLADPTLFLQKYDCFRAVQDSSQRRINLSSNFRSSATIVAAVNFIFRQIMTPWVGEIAYDKEAELVYSREDNSGGLLRPGEEEKKAEGDLPLAEGVKGSYSPPVEVWLVDLEGNREEKTEARKEELEEKAAVGKLREESEADTNSIAQDPKEERLEEKGELEEELEWLEAAEVEARLIAQKIKELVNSGWQLKDKAGDQPRPLSYRDIVVLMRTTRNLANIFVEEFRRQEIPVYAELATGYFAVPEVETIISLLRIIDNPRQDIPLLAVLYSPLVGLKAADLARIRVRQHGSFYEAVVAAREEFEDEEIKNKLQVFFSRLEKWRTLSRRERMTVLLREIYRDTGYYDLVGGLPAGMQRQANLRLLETWASKYETTGFKGLSQFLHFVERLQESGGDRGAARTLSESEDVARIMSIHRSKGLEFPIVFISGLGRKFNLEDIKRPLLMHKELGLGPQMLRVENGFSYPTLAKLALKERIKREMLAEEMRLLYVAMTRAREWLFLVGSCRNLNSQVSSWAEVAEVASLFRPEVGNSDANRAVALPDLWLSQAGCFLDWVGAALYRHSQAAVLRERVKFNDIPAIATIDQENERDSLLVKVVGADSVKSQDFSAYEKENALWERIAAGEALEGEDEEEEKTRREELKREIERRLSWTYPYADIAGRQAKLTVTEAKRFFALEEEETEAASTSALERWSLPLPCFLVRERRFTAAERGVAMHILMQHLDFSRATEKDAIEQQVSELVKKELLSPEQQGMIDVEAVLSFIKSSLGERLLRARAVWREVPFTLMLPAEEVYSDLASEKEASHLSEQILLQGVIDCVADEGDGFLILDYKTDYLYPDAVSGEDQNPGQNNLHRLRELENQYRWQLRLYARAVETILNGKVKDCYLYFLSARKAVRVDYPA